MPNLVTVLMPVYNAERYVSIAIDSILTQTYSNFELIILNDGSTDNSETIILSFNDNRIKYFKNETNLKIIKTLNRGVDLALGKYIIRMDADDRANPYLIEKSLENIEKQQADFSTVSYNYLSEDSSIIQYNKSRYIFSSEVLKYIIPYENYIGHPGITIKTDLLKKYKYNDNDKNIHFEDFELWNRLIFDGYKGIFINENLMDWRISSTSITHSKYQSDIIDKKVDFIKNTLKVNIGYTLTPYIEKYLCRNMYSELKSEGIILIWTEFNQYISFVNNKYKLNSATLNDLYYWRNFSIIIIGLRSFKIEHKISFINFMFFIVKAPAIFKYNKLKLFNVILKHRKKV